MPRVRSRDRFIADNITEWVTPLDGTAHLHVHWETPNEEIIDIPTPAPIQEPAPTICAISWETLTTDTTYHKGVYTIHSRYAEEYIIAEDTDELIEKANALYLEDEAIRVSEGCETETCEDCWNNTQHWRNSVNGWYICMDCISNYTRCEDCREYSHDDNVTELANWDYVCESCYEDHYFQCDECWEHYHNDYDTWDAICENCQEEGGDWVAAISWTDDTDIKTWSCRGSSIRWCLWSKGLTNEQVWAEQTSYKLSPVTKAFIKKRYSRHTVEFENVYKHKEINDTFNICVDKQSQKDIKRYFSEIKQRQRMDRYVSIATQQKNKYRNFNMEKLDWDKVEYSTTTIFWKKKTVNEPAATTFKYMEKLAANMNSWFSKAMFVKDSKFKVVMSNEQNHKVEALEKNEIFWTCQSVNNCRKSDWDWDTWYSRGAFDLIANGCNAPILIYDWTKLVWRILVRFMYDKDQKEFLFIDRLYSTWTLVDDKKEVYNKIVETLIDKWYSIIVSTSSAHDSSVYNFLKQDNKTLTFTEHTDVLRQPVRRKQWDTYYGYYSDSWTRCYSNEEWNIYDVACMTKFLVTK